MDKLNNEDGADNSEKSFKELIKLAENNKQLMKK